MKFVAIIQARLDSKRYPYKVLEKIQNKTIIQIIYERLFKISQIDKVIFAIPNTSNNNLLENYLIKNKYNFKKGSHKNLLLRYYNISKLYKGYNIIRITADCPLIDKTIIKKCISEFKTGNFDYVTNTFPPTFPDGYDVEIFSEKILEKAYLNAKTDYEKEHVTPYIKNNNFTRIKNIYSNYNLNFIKISIDTKEDFKNIIKLVKKFKTVEITFQKINKMYKKNKNFFKNFVNKIPNENKLGSGQKLYKRAKNIIPNGSLLFSKRQENFLPNAWPTYYSKAKGCHIWDLDGKRYADMCSMGVGTNILGYANNEVDNAVIENIKKSNMSTFLCEEEIALIERLSKLHPGLSMGRLCRTGGEASAVAIRIARSFTNTDKIAFCGYHGWHDWYLSSNLSKESSLDVHLMNNLDTTGVNKKLKNSSYAFNYNDYYYLENLVIKKNIRIIIMEVIRNIKPKDNFLKKVRSLSDKYKCILIFDECTSGFREKLGGIYKKYKVKPDMLILGKALGNGYAINALLGKKDIISKTKNSFISSTFWTERSGPTAALKVLEIMERDKTQKFIISQGRKIKKFWKDISLKYSLNLEISGLDALCKFSFPKNNDKVRTFITQEMLKKNFLATNTVYVSIDHKDNLLDEYFDKIEKVFKTLSKTNLQSGIEELLEYPVINSDFRRSN